MAVRLRRILPEKNRVVLCSFIWKKSKFWSSFAFEKTFGRAAALVLEVWGGLRDYRAG